MILVMMMIIIIMRRTSKAELPWPTLITRLVGWFSFALRALSPLTHPPLVSTTLAPFPDNSALDRPIEVHKILLLLW